MLAFRSSSACKTIKRLTARGNASVCCHRVQLVSSLDGPGVTCSRTSLLGRNYFVFRVATTIPQCVAG